MKHPSLLAALALLALVSIAWGEKSARVFIALCDNKTQGIMPVGAKIGDGDVPDANLYWGCSDGFGSYFKRSKDWKVIETASDVSPEILRRISLRHVKGDVKITADAYRGSSMRKCLEDFENAAVSGEHDLVAFIGHNGLMDFDVPEPAGKASRPTDAIVLCCKSDRYFAPRLAKLGCRPVLLTQQLMYPGAFILHDALAVWKRGGSLEEIRNAAAKAYAKNQKISTRAAASIFAPVRPASPAGETAP